MTTVQDVNGLVRGFARLLSVCWIEVTTTAKTSSTGSYLQDWLQANWEMFVEAALPPGTFLEPYGEGADCNEQSSRVYRPEALPSHVIVCRPRSTKTEIVDLLAGTAVPVDSAGLPLEEFVTMAGTWYERCPPFDCVLVEDAVGPRVFRIEDVEFALGPASRG